MPPYTHTGSRADIAQVCICKRASRHGSASPAQHAGIRGVDAVGGGALHHAECGLVREYAGDSKPSSLQKIASTSAPIYARHCLTLVHITSEFTLFLEQTIKCYLFSGDLHSGLIITGQDGRDAAAVELLDHAPE